MQAPKFLYAAIGLGFAAGALAAPPPPPKDVSDFGGAQPLNRAKWFSGNDYLAAAVAAHHSGTVDISFTIGVNGRVSGCSVVRSSGYADLDLATCPLLERRARFKPAVDDENRLKATIGTMSVPWRMWP
jgi:protein TonB